MIKFSKNFTQIKTFFLFAFFCFFSNCELQGLRWENYCLVNSKDASNDFVFIFVPKNGSSTFRIITNTLSLVRYNHLRHKDSLKAFIARDPLYRPISIYSEVMKLRFEKARTLSEDFYKNRKNLITSFKQFLYAIQHDFYEPHITHQHSFLEEKNLSLDDIDYVLLFENLDADIQLFCKLNGVDYQNYQENASSSKFKKILEYLILHDEEVRELIYSIWKKDFEFYEEAKKRRETIFKFS